LQDVVNITRNLNQYFPKTKDPVIVVNAGGWNRNGFTDEKLNAAKYQLISEALNELDLDGVTIAIQTMPPFPWHFGGQSYHNLFVGADEIVEFCKNNPKIKICLDISHSMMSCSYYGWDLLEFVEKVAPYNVHLHIVDAKGADGEGIEIGKGDVNFPALMSLLDSDNPNVPFIPEVWQGHKNGGEGFWSAFEFLETIK
ncbi:Type III antifreeze protein:CBS domain:NeuB family, partial [Moritella sp. PE36]|uniref:sugar phosphate isomerase/epimerase family protein n=1 Tax=Moritella sp. PE36 TaxID=58051 RepID=UPI0001568A2E